MKKLPNTLRCFTILFFIVFFSFGIPSLQAQENLLQTPISQDQLSFLTLKNQFRILGFLSLISLIPFGMMMMTSFLRISIVFQFLRQALGSSQIPSNQIIIGLSLILTGFVMQPVLRKAFDTAIIPYMQGELKKNPGVQAGTKSEEILLIEKIWDPLQSFLLAHARTEDIDLFLDISRVNFEGQKNNNPPLSQNIKNDVPWYCLIPAFMLSELRVAFMMGFLLFLPFLIIDMVVSAILMSMGMMMLPPIMVSTPCKILLFIMIDGWHLIVQQVISGFYQGN